MLFPIDRFWRRYGEAVPVLQETLSSPAWGAASAVLPRTGMSKDPQEEVAEGEAVKGQRLPSEPGGSAEAVAQPKQGLLARVPEEESGLHGGKSYSSEGAQSASAIRVRDCKDGRANGQKRDQIGALPAGASWQPGGCKDGRADRGDWCYFGGLRYWGGRGVIAKRGLARLWRRIVISFPRMKEGPGMEELAVSAIGERYGAFRIVSPRADAAMIKSIRKYGQISPVVCVKGQGGYELIDGFKRLRACRRLNKTTLRARTMEVSGRVCKAAIIQLNQSGRLINEMEEALVLQSLHREDGLTQIEIAVLLGRDKSWVSRRISLIERLSEEVQG